MTIEAADEAIANAVMARIAGSAVESSIRLVVWSATGFSDALAKAIGWLIESAVISVFAVACRYCRRKNDICNNFYKKNYYY